mmetsp:Transcript_48167/g.114758  ORF Transcript_48167/g.114758 Transcript_48167/m.114758 type:complete len:210 (+) Transcript_48167:447-1076(+)
MTSGSAPILTLPSRMRLLGSFLASKLKLTPLTCRKRPSKRGYWDTEFSSALSSCAPVSCSKQSSSSMGSRFTRSRTLMSPFSMIASARMVPLFSTATSAFSAKRMMSVMKLPMFVSLVRMEAKVLSRSTAVAPTSLSMAAPRVPMHSSTKPFISRSSAILLSTSTWWCSVTWKGLEAPSVNSSCRTVMSLKSVPLFKTKVPCGPTGFTS